MKKVGIKAIILILFLLHIPLLASEWQKELDAAKALGIKFSSDNKTLLKCPRDVEKAVIPSCVNSIGKHAFEFCYKLTGITIPNSVTHIAQGAFAEIKSVKVSPDHPTLMTDEAGALIDTKKGILLFFPPDYKGHYTIPDNVTQIGDEAFYGCKNLNNVTIPPGVTSIGYSAFEACSNLSRVSIPNSVIRIADKAFAGCRNLRHVTIPDCVKKIGNGAFSCCDRLTDVTIPGRVEFLGGEVFAACEELKSVTISDGVKYIADEAFWGCDNLSSVTIPDSIIRIGLEAFSGCDKLKSVTISAKTEYYPDSFPKDCKIIKEAALNSR